MAKQVDRPLLVQIPEAQHDISWHGLQQAASTTNFLGCEYIWLEFLCLNQLSKKDKALQIPNMGNIYKITAAVLVVICGIQAAHDLHSSSEWMEHTWTLQEATLCRNTYVIFQWGKEGHDYLHRDGSTCWIRKMPGGIAYASLVDLLAMVGKPPKLTLVAEYDVMESALENKSQNESADSDDASSKSSFDIFYDTTVGAAPVYEAGKMSGMSSGETVDMLLEPVAKNTANQGFQRIKCFNFSSQAGRLLRDILKIGRLGLRSCISNLTFSRMASL